jgi:hypothetical protein
LAECFQKKLRNLNAALDLFSEAEATWKSLADHSSTDLPYRLWQSGTGQSVGLILIEQGNKAEGLAKLQEALAVAESIAPEHQSWPRAQMTMASIRSAIQRTGTE